MAIVQEAIGRHPIAFWGRGTGQGQGAVRGHYTHSSRLSIIRTPVPLILSCSMDHPVGGKTKAVGLPVVLGRSPLGESVLQPPSHGEHTDQILQELGWTQERIVRERKSGVII